MISASALAPNCAYAKVLSAKRPRPATTVEAADRGTMFHAAVETWIKTGELPPLDDLEIVGWLDLLASQWLPPVNVELEIAWGLRPDGSYADVDEPEPHVYVARDGGELLTAGRADVAWVEERVLVLLDHKTGKWLPTPPEKNLQLWSGALALARRHNCDAVRVGIYFPRDGAFDWYPSETGYVLLDSNEALAMLHEVRTAALLPPEPRPGDWCGRCWERKGCGSAQR